MGGFTMMGGMGGMNPMMMGMGMMMPGLMPLMIMQQMMQMMQMLMMMMGQQQGGGFPGGGMPGGGCGCNPGIGPAMGNGFGFPGAGGGGYAPPYMPFGGGVPGGGGYGGYGGVPGYGDVGATGPLPWNPQSGNRLADLAGSWGGRHFKPGQTHRCADFVSTMIAQSGNAPPGFRHQVSCNELQRYGRPVDMQNLKPGDVVFFGNTYRPGRYTHTGIYLGNGRFAHRPTANKPVKIDNLNSRYWSQHFTGGRRLNG